MDASTGFKTATSQEPTQATAVMDPSHVLHLAGEALDRCPHRVQQQPHGHRDLSSYPLYQARRLLPTDTDLPTNRQRTRLQALFAKDDHLQVEATWGVYQRMVAAYH